MVVVHLVLMAFEPLATAEEIQTVVQSMMAQKDKCIHPTSKAAYIKSRVGGANWTSEGLARGYSHSFVLEFETEDDAKYYMDKDPEHLVFVESLSGIVSKTLVVDFTPGAF